jgi:4-carboxymuconolactone decarboxylase
MAAIKTVFQKVTATAVAALLLCGTAVSSEAQIQRPRNGFALKAPTTPEEIEAGKPNPQAPGFRIPLPPLDQMDAKMRTEFESNATTFHTPVGDRAPLLVTPEVEAAYATMQPALLKTLIPQDLYELTILMVAREWSAQLVWWIHAPQGPSEGIPAEAIEAIRVGKLPKFSSPGQEATYHYMAELLRDHDVDDATYERLRAIVGTRQVVEMTVLAGYYGIVGANDAAARIPMRSGVTPPLPPLKVRFPLVP